jgi:hypothetical protein
MMRTHVLFKMVTLTRFGGIPPTWYGRKLYPLFVKAQEEQKKNVENFSIARWGETMGVLKTRV